jgi:hypothetical protein
MTEEGNLLTLCTTCEQSLQPHAALYYERLFSNVLDNANTEFANGVREYRELVQQTFENWAQRNGDAAA